MKATITKTHSLQTRSHSSRPSVNTNAKGFSISHPQETGQPFFNSYPIQPKLTIGQPNDPFEKEADAMAEKAVSQTEFSKPSFIQTKCERCDQEEGQNGYYEKTSI